MQKVRDETHLRSPQPTEELCRLYHGIACAICKFWDQARQSYVPRARDDVDG